MKKLLLLLAFVTLSVTVVNAQGRSITHLKGQSRTIGMNLGQNIEISYQQYASTHSRFELDLNFMNGYYSSGFGVIGTYQYVGVFAKDIFGLNWYVGAGPGIGLWSKKFGIEAHAQVGLEYNFRIPLTISLDYRPTFYILPDLHFSGNGVSLGIRYRF